MAATSASLSTRTTTLESIDIDGCEVRIGQVISYYRWDLEETVRNGVVVGIKVRELRVTDDRLGTREHPKIASIDPYDLIVGCPIHAGKAGLDYRTVHYYV